MLVGHEESDLLVLNVQLGWLEGNGRHWDSVYVLAMKMKRDVEENKRYESCDFLLLMLIEFSDRNMCFEKRILCQRGRLLPLGDDFRDVGNGRRGVSSD